MFCDCGISSISCCHRRVETAGNESHDIRRVSCFCKPRTLTSLHLFRYLAFDGNCMHVRQGFRTTYHDILTHCTEVKSLSATRDDYFLMPSQVTVGDQSCVLAGCESPYILRSLINGYLQALVFARMQFPTQPLASKNMKLIYTRFVS